MDSGRQEKGWGHTIGWRLAPKMRGVGRLGGLPTAADHFLVFALALDPILKFAFEDFVAIPNQKARHHRAKFQWNPTREFQRILKLAEAENRSEVS